MKPSEAIELIREELSNKGWCGWGGNQTPKDAWENDTAIQNVYYVKAIVEYLDRKENE